MARQQNKHRSLVSAVRQCFPSSSEITTTTVTSTTLTSTSMTPTAITPSAITVDLTTQPTHLHRDDSTAETESESESIKRNFPPDVNLTLAMLTKAVTGIGLELFKLAHEWDTKRFELRYEYADYPLPTPPTPSWPLLPRHVFSLPKAEAFASSKIGQLVERAHVFVRAQMPFLARFHRDSEKRFSDIGNDVFRAFFNSELFPMPGNILSKESNFWTQDDCFADQFLNGCNPTIIKRLAENDIPDIPVELRDEIPLLGKCVQTLAKAGHLYVADYAVLDTPGIASDIHPEGSFTNEINFGAESRARSMTKHFYAPYVAFYQKDDGRLGVLGILLTRHKDRTNYVYNKRTCENKRNIYTFAKMHVACADNQVHQFYSHLGRCHLIFEPFGVAVRNVFQHGDAVARNHVVGRLLAPHFHDHIAINWLARNTLVAHGEDAIPFTDATFAIGSGGGLRLLARKYASWKLQDQAFPAQLRARGFDPNEDDGLCYYYRDDGMRIWRALESYVEESLKGFYESENPDEAAAKKERDAQVACDRVLQLWCAEMRDRYRAAVRSFPKSFTTLDMLCKTITTIIYNVSAEHAAVNASQERYLAYVPNRPNALFKPVPPPTAKDMDLEREVLRIHRARGDDDDVGASMPISFAVFQVQFSQLLTLPATRTLLQIKGEGLPPCATRKLKRDFERAQYEIQLRNKQIEEKTPHLAPYEFLDPGQVAQSIEI